MAPLSLKIVQDDGAVTRKVKLEPTLTVQQATAIVKEKALLPADAKPHGLFLRALDGQSGVWLEDDRTLAYYLLRDGDRLDYLCKIRNLRLRMLDGTVKTLQVDQSKIVEDLLVSICAKLGITNPEEYGLCFDPEEVVAERKENTGTLTLKKKSALHTRDIQFEELSKKLKTDDNVEWIDVHKALSETSLDPSRTLLLKRRLYYSDRKVDARDPVQLNLLYVQTRDNILTSIHPVTEEKAADCKVRWINIRDVHRRILRLSMTRSTRPKRAYKYDKHMDFIKTFYKVVSPSNGEENSDNEDEPWTDAVDYDESPEEVDSKPIKKRKRNKSPKKSNSFEEIELPSEPVVHEAPEIDVSDPVDTFLISIGATLKRFSPYHLNLAKSKIFHIVQEHDLQQIVDRQPRDSIATDTPVYYQG